MEDFRKLQKLCMLETGKTPADRTDAIFTEFMATKRAFTREELVNTYLLKVGELCGGYLVHLREDGTLEECYLFKPEKTWFGTWSVDAAGVLHIACPSENEKKQPVMCLLETVASRHGATHAGCENTDDPTNEIVEHFKVLFLGRQICMPGLQSAAAVAAV